jgi:multiple sugar transport system substrate-binding protein
MQDDDKSQTSTTDPTNKNPEDHPKTQDGIQPTTAFEMDALPPPQETPQPQAIQEPTGVVDKDQAQPSQEIPEKPTTSAPGTPDIAFQTTMPSGEISTAGIPVYASSQQNATPSAQPPNPTTSTVTPPSPKRGIPKVLVMVLGAIVLVAILFFAIRFISGLRKPKTVNITYWGMWEDETIIAPLIKEYEETNPGVKVSYVKQSKEDYRERLTSALAKGNGPDVFRFHNTWVPMFNKELDNIPASVMNASDFAQTFYPVAATNLGMGTGLVGIPLEYDAITLFINEEIFQQENMQPPETWDDLRVLAKILTKTENNEVSRAGVALGRTENVDHWQEILALMMIQNGVDLSNPTSQRAADALTYYTLFSQVDGVWNETLPPSTVAFANGKLAMYFGPSWRAFNFKEMNPNLKFRTVSLPQVPKDDPDEPDVSYATYWVEGVWARSPNKDEAWQFLKFLSQKENLEKFYQSASSMRGFGEPYPRVDMAETLLTHPVAGSIIKLAPVAQSWYLVDRTFDGATGINTQINTYYGDAVNAVNAGIDPLEALSTTAQGVSEVLSQYGLSQ